MAVERVVIIPRNGYVNRLQALVSAQILAEELDASLGIAWIPQPAAPAVVSDVLKSSVWDSHVINASEVLPDGMTPDTVPVGVTQAPGRVLMLAGGINGEQALMPQLREQIKQDPDVITIVAGGKFWLQGDNELSPAQAADFRTLRRNKYAHLHLNDAIETAAEQFINGLPESYLGLHLRYSDRNLQAPLRRTIEQAVAEEREASGNTIFLCGDDPRKLNDWSAYLARLGWDVRMNETSLGSASSRRPASALVDWRILASSSRVVFFAESSFGEESAVASGHFDESVGLRPSQMRASALRAAMFIRSAVTYPARHWG